MLNIIWPIFIILSIGYGFLTGRIEDVNNSIFTSCSDAVKLTITFFGTICMWNGIIQIASKTCLMKKITKLLNPIIRFLFPDIKKEDKAHEEISMNMVANMLGIGNAATPLGLKAMKSMQRENRKKDELTNSMAMFIVINTASLQIIPTTVIAIRNSLGSKNPSGIIFQVWVATILAAIAAVSVTKLFIKIGR